LAFATVAHADRIAYGSEEYVACAEGDFRFLAPSAEPLRTSDLLIKRGNVTAFRTVRSLSASDDLDRFTNNVFYSDLVDSTNTDENVNAAEFDSIRRRLNGFPGTRDDGSGEHIGVVHSGSFDRALATVEVPEPNTLLLVGMGFIALTIWKWRSARYA
jgi:hypothetical protein